VPIGAAVVPYEDGHLLHGVIASVDGAQVVRGGRRVEATDPAAAGRALAADLHAAGGEEILAALRSPS
jgi:porphobilinogen deaminase